MLIMSNTSHTSPSIIRFEQAVTNKQYEVACIELLSILEQINHEFGSITGIECDIPNQLESLDIESHIHFCTRMAVAITHLFEDPQLEISPDGGLRLLSLQRWIALIFASSPYVNADHILKTYDINKDNHNPENINLENGTTALIKFCIMYLPESNITLVLDTIWEINPELTASLCFALQSPRFIGTKSAFDKRGAILQWLPEKLTQIKHLTNLPTTILHDVYMHCSYDTSINKHNIKKSLNHLIRQELIKEGWQDCQLSKIGKQNNKPVMIVLLEHFNASHSIYRTHSTSMIAAREYFYLVGIGNDSIDEAGKAVFDEFQLLPHNKAIFDKLTFVKEVCEKYGASVLYMPSIGMDLTTIFISNTRLAPIQAVALGHPATTHSAFIDYVVVEDDYVGSEACFSETLIRLPKDALPYVPSALTPKNIKYCLRKNPEVVQIGIATTTMKLNPHFMETLKAIKDSAKVKVHFHFALGLSMGISRPYVTRFIKSYLGNDATAHPHLPYNQYLDVLHQCDMMLNPFPFGNTNGIIDMVTLGLVGICKTGAEVHEHIDEGLFRRLGLPTWLITKTTEEYVACAIRLAENHTERLAIRKQIIENNRLNTLFNGDAKPMGQVFLQKVQQYESEQLIK